MKSLTIWSLLPILDKHSFFLSSNSLNFLLSNSKLHSLITNLFCDASVPFYRLLLLFWISLPILSSYGSTVTSSEKCAAAYSPEQNIFVSFRLSLHLWQIPTSAFIIKHFHNMCTCKSLLTNWVSEDKVYALLILNSASNTKPGA